MIHELYFYSVMVITRPHPAAGRVNKSSTADLNPELRWLHRQVDGLHSVRPPWALCLGDSIHHWSVCGAQTPFVTGAGRFNAALNPWGLCLSVGLFVCLQDGRMGHGAGKERKHVCTDDYITLTYVRRCATSLCLSLSLSSVSSSSWTLKQGR